MVFDQVSNQNAHTHPVQITPEIMEIPHDIESYVRHQVQQFQEYEKAYKCQTSIL